MNTTSYVFPRSVPEVYTKLFPTGLHAANICPWFVLCMQLCAINTSNVIEIQLHYVIQCLWALLYLFVPVASSCSKYLTPSVTV